MKLKSISVQNLENLIRQTINTAPENNDETMKFYQMINDEWYFKKLCKSKSMKEELNYTKPQITNEQDISAIAYRRLRRPKYKRRSNKSSVEIQRVNTSPNIKTLSTNDVSTLVLQNNEDSLKNKDQICFVDCTTITDNPDIDDDGEIIEIWNGRKRTNGPRSARKNIDAANTQDRNDGEENLEQQQKTGKKSITFEAWARSKNIAYRKKLKQLEKEKQQKASAALEAKLKKRAILQAQRLVKKRQQQQQQHRRIRIFSARYIAKSNCNRVKEKPVNERKIVEEPRKQASTSMTRKLINRNNDRKKQMAVMQGSLENVIFYSWLDQLNWILHKKYLRERRHLVRSFYCQPIYYGDATLYVT